MNDIDDSLCLVVGTLIGLLSRRVGSDIYIMFPMSDYALQEMGALNARDRGGIPRTNVVVANSNLLAIGLVDYIVNELKVIRIRDDLVAGDQVLKQRLVGTFVARSRGLLK